MLVTEVTGLKLIAACILGAYLFMDPAGAVRRAGEAMALWADKVAPSVFPFLVLLPFFLSDGSCRVFERLFGRVLYRLFRLKGGAAASVFAGLAAGSPAGAIACRNAYAQGKITSAECMTVMVLSSGLSPAFLVFSVGQGMFSDALYGLKILVITYLSGVLGAVFVSRLPHAKTEEPFREGAALSDTGAIQNAVNAVLSICGWMVVFAVFTGKLPESLSVWAEVSGGCAKAAARGNGALACALCCFSGGCVLFQNLQVILKMKLDAALFFLMKCFQAALGSAMYFLFDRIQAGAFVLKTDAFEISCAVSVGAAVSVYLLSIKEPRIKRHANETKGN